MVRRKGCCMSCLVTIAAVIIVLVAGVIFGGNYVLKTYVGNTGSYKQLEINNWRDLDNVVLALRAYEPQLDDGDRVSSINTTSALVQINSKLGKSYTPSDGDKLTSDLGASILQYKLYFTGGELASLCAMTFDAGQAKLEAMNIAVIGESAATLKITYSADLLGMKSDLTGFAKWLVERIFKADKLYITYIIRLYVDNGVAKIEQINSADTTLSVNNRTPEESRKTVKAISGFIEQDVSRLVGDIADKAVSMMNKIGRISFSSLPLTEDGKTIPSNHIQFDHTVPS